MCQIYLRRPKKPKPKAQYPPKRIAPASLYPSDCTAGGGDHGGGGNTRAAAAAQLRRRAHGGARRLGDPGETSPQTPPPLSLGLPRMAPPHLHQRLPPTTKTATSSPSTASAGSSTPSPGSTVFCVEEACCDGIPVLWRKRSIDAHSSVCFSICNPTTRQSGDVPLPLLSGFMLTGEYRLLLYRIELPASERLVDVLISGDRNACYVYTLGFEDLPRCIGWPEAEANGTSVLLRGSLHWYKSTEDMILVFDTTAESFRWMRSPFGKTVCIVFHGLFEINCALGMYCCDDGVTIVDIWVLGDYKREVWSLKYRVELPVLEIRRELDEKRDLYSVMVFSEDGDVLVLVNCKRSMLYIDADGKLLASLSHDNDGLSITPLKLKASLVPHVFFPSLLDYVVNASPFV